MSKLVRSYIFTLQRKTLNLHSRTFSAPLRAFLALLSPAPLFGKLKRHRLTLSPRRHCRLALPAALLFATCLLSAQTQSASPVAAPGAEDLARLHRLLESPRPITWVFTGDSVTQGAKWTGDSRPYPAIFAERVRWELHRSRDIVINTAISGNRAQDILDDFNWRVAHLHPDVVSLMIGMNDSIGGSQKEQAFAADLAKLVRRIRALGAIPILHTTNTTLYDRDRVDLPQYNAIIRSVAASWHVILVDNWSYWQQNRTPANLAEWLGNPIHPNGLGHIQITRQLLETLGIFDPASAVGQFGAEPVAQKSPTQHRP